MNIITKNTMEFLLFMVRLSLVLFIVKSAAVISVLAYINILEISKEMNIKSLSFIVLSIPFVLGVRFFIPSFFITRRTIFTLISGAIGIPFIITMGSLLLLQGESTKQFFYYIPLSGQFVSLLSHFIIIASFIYYSKCWWDVYQTPKEKQVPTSKNSNTIA